MCRCHAVSDGQTAAGREACAVSAVSLSEGALPAGKGRATNRGGMQGASSPEAYEQYRRGAAHNLQPPLDQVTAAAIACTGANLMFKCSCYCIYCFALIPHVSHNSFIGQSALLLSMSRDSKQTYSICEYSSLAKAYCGWDVVLPGQAELMLALLAVGCIKMGLKPW